jgi:hypothetical protein
MPDQLQTTEGALYDRAFPPKDLAYWLGSVLHAPVAGIPTREDLLREQGHIGLPSEDQVARQTGQGALDYVTQFLGPLMALMTSRQYARTKEGHPARTWKDQADYTKANSPLDAMLSWQKSKPWENRPPEGESAWTYRNPPQIGGPTGAGMSKEAILAAIEKEKFQGMLKQIQESEAREALAQRVMPRPARPPEPEVPIDEARLEAVLERLRQGGLPSARELAERMRLPGLPGD